MVVDLYPADGTEKTLATSEGIDMVAFPGASGNGAV